MTCMIVEDIIEKFSLYKLTAAPEPHADTVRLVHIDFAYVFFSAISGKACVRNIFIYRNRKILSMLQGSRFSIFYL